MDYHMVVNILVTNVVSVISTVTSAHKCGKCYKKRYLTIYILLIDIKNAM
jgi:hypothetical protein